jgi:long-chain acyl-CoA synthetase
MDVISRDLQNRCHAASVPGRTGHSKEVAMNLAVNLVRSAARHADRTAVRLDNHALSYSRLDELSAAAAGLLRDRGLREGDRVAVMLPNVPAFAVVYFAILRAGGVVVPMNPLLKEREIGYYLSDSGAELMFASAASADQARAGSTRTGTECILVDDEFEALLAATTPATLVADRAAIDTAVILYTSGTTGRPKGAELTHANLLTNTDVMATDLLRLTPQDVIFGGLPLFHSFGQTCGLNAATQAGACLTLMSRFSPELAMTVLARDRVTVFEGVPTMYIAMLGASRDAEHDVSALRMCVSGGASLPVEVLRGFEATFRCTILEGYGLSETSPVSSFNHPDRVRKPGSIGTPIRGVHMRLLTPDGRDVEPGAVGEIAVRGHNVMKGYWRRAAETAEAIPDGWFRTGDLARVDNDGYFFIVDRKKELIIRGGYNVYPREIEEVLYEHPAISEAAVVGVPDTTLGEEVGAAVVLAPDAATSADEIREFVRNQVAAYKYPRHVWIVDALPKGPTGKILKRLIEIPVQQGTRP